jgi:hypothetical protein
MAGLNVGVEGTRTWRAMEAAVGRVGEVDPAATVAVVDPGAARKSGAEGMRASLRGLGDGAAIPEIRGWVRDCFFLLRNKLRNAPR